MLLEPGCNTTRRPASDPAPGIPQTLAAERAQTITNLRYNLSFDIPAESSEPIEGHAGIHFTRTENSEPLVLDFGPGAEAIRSVRTNGKASKFRSINGHI